MAKQVFDEMPRIEGERLLLREMCDSDVAFLEKFCQDEEVYRFLPTFLYEQKYEDKHLVVARMRQECFDTHESIMLAVCFKDDPEQMIGIAEIYAYEERKPKVSIGCRLGRQWWGQGIATEVEGMLVRYLIDEVGVRTITGHVMCDNAASERAATKSGFRRLYTGVWEDWGFDEPVQIDKFVYKRRWEQGFLDD